ncbi:MAG: hypothetical protein KC550_06795, partial [Nanoarchaeota archaeon]|nr:hypothetical protein [Nanoarchaeota archaeon]
KLSEDGIPILKKLNEEKKPISEHSIVDLVFDNETNKLFEEKLSFNLSNDNLEIKLEMAEFLYRYFKNNRYDEWGEKHIGNYENLSLGELSDEQLKFKFMSDYFDEFNRRNGIIIAGKKIPINLKRKNFFITPMYKLVQFSFLQYFRPLLEVDKKFSSEKMSLIMKNTYENLILASANREQRNAYYINTITSNEANGYYILDQNEMRIVEVPEMIKKYSFLPGKINELFREEYSRVRSGCPVRKMRGNHFGISLLKEMFLVETQIYSKIYERFYNS